MPKSYYSSKYAAVGDVVRIVRPFLFERVGYPLTTIDIINQQAGTVGVLVQAAWDAITRKLDEINKKAGEKAPPEFSISYNAPPNRISQSLEKAVTLHLLAQAGWGGKNREIHETEDPTMLGVEILVIGKKIVKTGIYHSGYRGGYNGEWEPPYLADEKTHCLYQFQPLPQYANLIHKFTYGNHYILATNCERRTDDIRGNRQSTGTDASSRDGSSQSSDQHESRDGSPPVQNWKLTTRDGEGAEAAASVLRAVADGEEE